ncbi:MAG: hypothetical protein ACREDJ_06070 [Methylocella sp.]
MFRGCGRRRRADAKQARRVLAIAMGLDGHSRLVAARAGGMDRRTPRGWAKPAKGSSWRSQLAEQALPKRSREAWLAEGCLSGAI